MTTPAVVTRRVRPDEHATVGEVTVAAYAPFTRGEDDSYTARLRDTATRDAEAEVWVALDSGPDRPSGSGLLGSVTVCPPGSPWRELATDGEGEFRMLAVSPAAQGRGVGSLLAGLVVERFRADGAHAVVLSSLPEMTSAHRLYERLGFVRAPDRDWDPSGDVHLLAFRLSL